MSEDGEIIVEAGQMNDGQEKGEVDAAASVPDHQDNEEAKAGPVMVDGLNVKISGVGGGTPAASTEVIAASTITTTNNDNTRTNHDDDDDEEDGEIIETEAAAPEATAGNSMLTTSKEEKTAVPEVQAELTPAQEKRPQETTPPADNSEISDSNPVGSAPGDVMSGKDKDNEPVAEKADYNNMMNGNKSEYLPKAKILENGQEDMEVAKEVRSADDQENTGLLQKPADAVPATVDKSGTNMTSETDMMEVDDVDEKPKASTVPSSPTKEVGNVEQETGKVKGAASEEEEDEAKDHDTEEELKEEEMDEMSRSDDGAVDTADTASVDMDNESEMEDIKKAEPSYSTRGSRSGTATPSREDSAKRSTAGAGSTGGNSEQWERSVRDALEGLGRSTKEPPLAAVGPGGTSFLEALGEEERRTRTRYLPAVDGIHMLRKNEIKSDLSLSRSTVSTVGQVTSVASVAGTSSSTGLAKKSKKKEAMDTDDGIQSVASEDDRSSDSGKIGSATIEVEDAGLFHLPSTAFVPPLAATQCPPGKPEESILNLGVNGILNNQRNIKSPRIVESVTAFNPPRPPESVGKKKQHRMLRWERRPADVEVDLNNYRKTVDRTRKELHTAEDQLERIESTSNHLRRHFMNHLRFIDQEYKKIVDELDAVQQECVSGADLLTSRTRSRGAGKGSVVMRDVLAVLKARGQGVIEKGLTSEPGTITSAKVQNHPGVGGVGASSFFDWKHDVDIPSHPIASAWVLPGDKVDTPYGEGTVVKVFNTAAIDMKESPLEDTLLKSSSNGNSPTKMDVEPHAVASGEESKSILSPRICVQFKFGMGYFSPSSVTSKECPDGLTDSQLVRRWKGLIETALSQSLQLDLEGMTDSFITKKDLSESGDVPVSSEAPMDVVEKKAKDSNDVKLLPFGSSLLPTCTGRGSNFCGLTTTDIQKEFKPVFEEGGGVLGDPANEGVPETLKKFEAQRQEFYTLQAKVFHLRNQLYRQTKIRVLNERMMAGTAERSARVENLVAETRTDLKTLKNRLDEELVELGLDQEKADGILKSYYLAQEKGTQQGNEGPAKKRARSSNTSNGDAAAKRSRVTNQ